MSGCDLSTGRLLVTADSSDQGHCPSLGLLHLGHSAAQRFENAYLAPSKGPYVQAAIDRKRVLGHEAAVESSE
jgi:hypothetical protein